MAEAEKKSPHRWRENIEALTVAIVVIVEVVVRLGADGNKAQQQGKPESMSHR